MDQIFEIFNSNTIYEAHFLEELQSWLLDRIGND